MASGHDNHLRAVLVGELGCVTPNGEGDSALGRAGHPEGTPDDRLRTIGSDDEPGRGCSRHPCCGPRHLDGTPRPASAPDPTPVTDFLGVDVGIARLPHPTISASGINALRSSLEELGFFNWVRSPQ